MIRSLDVSFDNLYYMPTGLSGPAVLHQSSSAFYKEVRRVASLSFKQKMARKVPLSSCHEVVINQVINGVRVPVTYYRYKDDYLGRIEWSGTVNENIHPITAAIQTAFRPKNPKFWERVRRGEIVCSSMYATNLLLDSPVIESLPDLSKSAFKGLIFANSKSQIDSFAVLAGWTVLSYNHSVSNYGYSGPAFNTPHGVLAVRSPAFREFETTDISVVHNAESLGFDADYTLGYFFKHVNDPSVYKFDEELITKTLAAANSGQMDLLTTVAELPKTLETIMTMLKRVAGFTKNAFDKEKTVLRLATNRKRKKEEYGRKHANLGSRESRKAVQSTADAVAEVWMTWRYEIMPTVYTLVDYGNVLLNLNSAFKTERELLRQEIPVPMFEGWTPSQNHVIIKNNAFIKDRYHIETLIGDLGRLLTTNVLITGWELLKRSFVIDWFINIGEFITSIFGYQDYLQRVSSYSFKLELKDLTYVHDDTGLRVRIWGESYKRILIDSGAFINLSPRFDMNWKRYTDSVAMAWPIIKNLFNDRIAVTSNHQFTRSKLKKRKYI